MTDERREAFFPRFTELTPSNDRFERSVAIARDWLLSRVQDEIIDKRSFRFDAACVFEVNFPCSWDTLHEMVRRVSETPDWNAVLFPEQRPLFSYWRNHSSECFKVSISRKQPGESRQIPDRAAWVVGLG
jgi:hypothetical protein